MLSLIPSPFQQTITTRTTPKMADQKIHFTAVDKAAISDEENGNFDRSWRDEKWAGRKLSTVAQDQSASEANMSVREALKHYKPAVCWCLVR